MRAWRRPCLAALALALGIVAVPHSGAEDVASLRAVLGALQAAWAAGDPDAYLALWHFPDEAARSEERSFAEECFARGAAQLQLPRPERLPEGRRLAVPGSLAIVDEPRGRLERHRFAFEAGHGTWRIVARVRDARIDGLLHLSLDPQGYRAAGLSLALEDFVLRFEEGTLFLAPETVGPTLLTFAGEATVHVSPRPRVEREELERFSGSPELVDRVKRAFVRIHPADLHRVLRPLRLEPDPGAGRRLDAARRFYDQHVGTAFRLDAELPGSPWWILPSLGDASVTFETRRHGTLTFAVERSAPESLTLFDRARRLQICRYPSRGRSTRFDEDAGRALDVVSHDIVARFEPDEHRIEATDTLRLRLLHPASALSLRLAESLSVHSVTSAEGRELLFFRVPHQQSILVPLDPGVGEETRLTIRYGGRLEPEPMEHEAIQVVEGMQRAAFDDLLLERVQVFTGRTAWYPHPGDDYATATLLFDVPEGHIALSGGEALEQRTAAGRTLLRYRQDLPGRYVAVALGRLRPAGRREGTPALSAWATPRLATKGEATLEQAAEILRFFAGEFGPMPYPWLTLALVEGTAPGGHSPPGMVLLRERPVFSRGRLREDPASFHDVPGFFLAHELAHQWWGHGVAGENYHERWLSEGVAQYAATLWTQHALGEERFRQVLERLGRWARRMTDRGPISLGQRLGHVQRDPQAFRAVVYDKGAYVLHMLRGLVGPDAFRAALTDVQQRHRFDKIGTADLQAALEASSGRSLGPYLDAWIDGSELPELDWWLDVERDDDVYRTRVTVRPRHLPGPLPLQIAFDVAGARHTHVVELGVNGGTFAFETEAKPRNVEINGDGGLLAFVRKR